MYRRQRLLSVFLLAVLASVVGAQAETKGEMQKQRPAILLELFTSEGCSSCPPADALLPSYEKLGNGDSEVIVLSEHVDYWDYLGWKDPSSKPLFSARQSAYCRQMGLSSCYTPQLVVNGEFECNGASAGAVKQLVERAKQRRDSVSLDVQAHQSENKTDFVAAIGPSSGRHSDSGELYVAVVADKVSSQVRSGENSGRDLVHHAVVLSLRKLAKIPLSSGGSCKFSLNLSGGQYLVSFVQDADSGHILGATSYRR